MTSLSNLTHYEVLGVTKVASTADIKKAYRQKALRHHPDKDCTEHATAFFQRILEAYEVLGSARLRFLYDADVRKCAAEEAHRMQNEAARQRVAEDQEMQRSMLQKRLVEVCKEGAIFEAMKLLRGSSHSDINALDELGRTCLMYAIECHAAQMVSLLILYHADVNLASPEGWSPMMEAVGSATQPTHGNAHAGLSCLRALLEAKAVPNATTHAGTTALLLACASGRSSMVHCLLQYAADANIGDDSALTPLSLAADGGHVEVISALLKAGACVDVADSRGRPALVSAVYAGHKDVIAMLLEAEADPSRRSADGCSALMSATECLVAQDDNLKRTHAVEIVSVLLHVRADPNGAAIDGDTPLRLAQQAGDAEAVAMLLGKGITSTLRPCDAFIAAGA
jgi:ankyrin repeat protein